MKLGIYSNAYKDLPLEQALAKISAMGIEMVEIGCGEESGFAHCQPAELLADEEKLNAFKALFKTYGLQISALSCHGNPVSPNREIRELSDGSMRNAVLLAEKLGLTTINCFSGCPGDSETSLYSNWITVGWPLDYEEAYRWQWEQKLLPYWKEFTAFARQHHVAHIALELHPGQCCYNPRTLKRLREACGEEIGVNLDFSHLLWERMDPIAVIRELKGMIYHMHAKDIAFDKQLVRENGLINTDYFDFPEQRSWNFRTVGYGHGAEFWRGIFAELRRCGYDYVSSIELECEVLCAEDGAKKAVDFLKSALPEDLSPEDESWQASTRANRLKRFEAYGLA